MNFKNTYCSRLKRTEFLHDPSDEISGMLSVDCQTSHEEWYPNEGKEDAESSSFVCHWVRRSVSCNISCLM